MIGHGSVAATTLVLTASSIGTGILTLPWAIQEAGLLLGPLLLIASALVCNISMNVLMFGSRERGCLTYAQLVIRTLRWGPLEAVIEALIFLEVIFAVASYLVFLGDFVPALLDNLDFPTWLWWLRDRRSIIIIFAVASYPICLPKKLSFLRYASVISVTCLLYVTAAVVAKTSFYMEQPIAVPDVPPPPASNNMTSGGVSGGIDDDLTAITAVGASVIETVAAVRAVAASATAPLSNGGVPAWHTVPLFNFGWNSLKAFLISTYAFFCHFNVVPAGVELHTPSPRAPA